MRVTFNLSVFSSKFDFARSTFALTTQLKMNLELLRKFECTFWDFFEIHLILPVVFSVRRNGGSKLPRGALIRTYRSYCTHMKSLPAVPCSQHNDGILDSGSEALTCAFNRRGTLLAVGCNDGRIAVWDFMTRGIARMCNSHIHPITSLRYSAHPFPLLLTKMSSRVPSILVSVLVSVLIQELSDFLPNSGV